MADYIDTTLVDGFAGGPHITEEQIGLINQGTYGPDDYVLEEGSQAEAEVLTNNSIRIKDAVFVIQGRRDVMAANDYEDISIDNGAQGVNRNDIIVRRYQKDESSEIESVSFAVIKGTATEGTATDPEVPTGDIRTGALLHNMKLYRVRIEGLNIVAVEPLFKVLMNAESVQEMIAELNSKHNDSGWINMTPTGNFSNMLRFRKIGNVVYVCGGLHFSDNGAFFDDQWVGTVPTGMIPQQNYNTYGCIIPIAQHDGSGNIARVYIRPDNGRIYITGTGSAKNTTISIASYLTDD